MPPAPIIGWSVSMFSRAGLVALIFALIISAVSAVPVPTHSGHSSTLSQPNVIQRDTNLKLTQVPLYSPISRVSATTEALTGVIAPRDADNQLVRRGLGAKIRAAFHKLGHAIKHLAHKIGAGIKKVARKIGNGIKKVAHKIGNGIKKVARKIGNGIKKVARKIGNGIKKVAKKIGNGIKKAAKKVWHFVKTTGAKIVKFGLKVVATVSKAVSKVVGFIPGVGKLIGKGIEAESKLTNLVSDKIHVSLGKKLDKGMAVMNKANKVMGYIPRRRDLSEEEDFYY